MSIRLHKDGKVYDYENEEVYAKCKTRYKLFIPSKGNLVMVVIRRHYLATKMIKRFKSWNIMKIKLQLNDYYAKKI